MDNRWGAALAGVLAALAGLAVGQLVAALGDSAYAPIQVVGASATDLAPIALKEWATSTFGTASKTVVVIVVAIAVLAIAVVAGPAARRACHRIVVTALPGFPPLDVPPGLRTGWDHVGAPHADVRERRASAPPHSHVITPAVAIACDHVGPLRP